MMLQKYHPLKDVRDRFRKVGRDDGVGFLLPPGGHTVLAVLAAARRPQRCGILLGCARLRVLALDYLKRKNRTACHVGSWFRFVALRRVATAAASRARRRRDATI